MNCGSQRYMYTNKYRRLRLELWRQVGPIVLERAGLTPTGPSGRNGSPPKHFKLGCMIFQFSYKFILEARLVHCPESESAITKSLGALDNGLACSSKSLSLSWISV